MGSTASITASSQTTTIISGGVSGGFGGGGSGGFGGGGGGSGGFGGGGSGGFGGGGGGAGAGAPAGAGGGTGGGSGSGGGGGGTGGGGDGGFGGGGGGGGGGAGGGGGGPGGQQDSSLPDFKFRADGKAAGNDGARTAIWGQGLYGNMDLNEKALEMSGDIYSAMFGIDRRYYDRYLVGVAAGWEYVDINTAYNQGYYRSQGLTLAPYVGVNLTPSITLDASAGYTWLWYESGRKSGGTADGDFDGGRWFVSANLTSNFAYQNWRFQPKASVVYSKETQNAYYENTGAYVAENAFAGGRASAGGKVGYAFGNLLPYGKLMGEWDFKKANAVLKSNGEMSNIDDGGGVAGLGIEHYTGGMTSSLEVDYGSIGRKDLDLWMVIGRMRYQF